MPAITWPDERLSDRSHIGRWGFINGAVDGRRSGSLRSRRQHEDISTRVASGRIVTTADALAFEQLEEALGHSVVVTVATTTHAADQVVVAHERLPLVASKTAALIGMNNDWRLRLATPERHQHCIEHQTIIHKAAHRPAHRLPGELVDHDCQLKPTFMCSDVRDVGDRGPVGLGHRELTLKVIRRDRCWIATSHAWPATLALGQACPSVFAAPPTEVTHVQRQLAVAIDAPPFQTCLFEQTEQS